MCPCCNRGLKGHVSSWYILLSVLFALSCTFLNYSPNSHYFYTYIKHPLAIMIALVMCHVTCSGSSLVKYSTFLRSAFVQSILVGCTCF